MIKIDGHDNAIRGYGSRINMADCLIYDVDTIIDNLSTNGMTHEEALEWFDYNIIGAWMGDSSPVFLYEFNEDEY